MVFHIVLVGNFDHWGPGQHWRNQKSHRSALSVLWQIWNKFLEEKLDLPLLSRQQVLPKHVDEEINCFARVLGSATFFHPAYMWYCIGPQRAINYFDCVKWQCVETGKADRDKFAFQENVQCFDLRKWELPQMAERPWTLWLQKSPIQWMVFSLQFTLKLKNVTTP